MLIKTTPDKLPKQLAQRFRATPQVVAKGLLAGAHRGRTILVRRTPKDRGQARRGWRVVKRRSALTGSVYRVDLANDAPYVGVLELGARPHPVSKEGFLSILGWVRRHGLMAEAPKGGKAARRTYYGQVFTGRRALEAEVAWNIVRKLRRVGQAPTYFVRNSMPMLQRAVAEEVKRVVTRLANTKAPKGGKP